MSTLAEHALHLSQLAHSIQSNASDIAQRPERGQPSIAGPFTRAILETPLGDLIRDIDPAEIGLFTLVQPTQSLPTHAQEDVPVPPKGEIARVEFSGATPLRRPPARQARDDPARPREHEPEVYAQAALKYLDRYTSIRPMPRASEQAERIIEQLSAVRDNIYELSETLKQMNVAGPSNPPLSPKSAITAEERHIQEIGAEMLELKQKKEALLKKKTGIRGAHKPGAPKSKPRPPPPPTSPDAQEESFWNTPAATARTLHFTDDLLTDENMDLANMSSFASPIPESKSHARSGRGNLRSESAGRHMAFSEPAEKAVLHDESPELEDVSINNAPLLQQLEAARHHSPEPSLSRADEDDATIRMTTVPVAEAVPTSAEDQVLHSVSSEIPRRTKLKVTTELETIVVKIWSTVGDVIMPGNPFDVHGINGPKPPHAKETIAHLHSLSTQEPVPGSPTTSLSSLATAPPPAGQVTTHQLLIAHVLLALLKSPPQFTMPLNKLKTLITETDPGKKLIGTAITKPIYALVAKRCLKIDRSGKEQVVRFMV